MSNSWILDVLADLKSFAIRNDLAALAEQLDDTTLIAATELASKDGGERNALKTDVDGTRSIFTRVAGSENA